MAPSSQLRTEVPNRPDSPAPNMPLAPRTNPSTQRRDPAPQHTRPDHVSSADMSTHPARPDSPSPVRSPVVAGSTDPPSAAAFLRPDSPRPPGMMPQQNVSKAPVDDTYIDSGVGSTIPSPGQARHVSDHFAQSRPEGSALVNIDFDPSGLGDEDHLASVRLGRDEGEDHYINGDGDDRMMDMMSLEAIYSVQKMAEVLVVGPDSEREFIIFELQQLLDHCLDDTMKILLPVLCEHVPTWSVSLQIKSAQRLFDVVSLQLEPLTANMITCASFGVIQAAKGKPGLEFEELYNLWGSILVDVLPNMKWTPQEVSDVIAIIDIHASERLFTSRKVAARVLGALAQCLERSKVEKMILPRAIELFSDEDVEVRGTIVESLAFIGAALPVRITETEVWPRVERLLEPPEDARIRATAMRTMAHILQIQRDKNNSCKLFRDLLPPVFARLSTFARKFSAEDQRLVDDDTYLLLEVVSEVFGQFLYTLSLYTRKSFRKEAYKGYAGMATCNGPLIRRNCAFNLPGVAKALGERYAIELSGLCEFLAKDTDEEVRWILAAGIHQSATLLAPRGHFERLFTAVCSLLQDENPLVRMNALGHFHELLSAFVRDGNDPASVRRLAPVFTNLTMLSEGEWRIQRSLAEQLDKCADIIPADALVENVLPLLYRLTEQGTPLVREAAMKATAHSLRNIPSVSDRNAAINRFWNKAADGPFWMRLALLDGGAAAMKIFSRQRFAELFAAKVLTLASDPVANVRIRLAGMMASMAPMCAGAPEYNAALELLRRDKDVDVLAHMASHNERSAGAYKEARETAADDQIKFREEQEFYGITQRSQKRGRGRLNSIRGNRGMYSRQHSLEQSAGHLSVAQSVLAGNVTPGNSVPSITSLTTSMNDSFSTAPMEGFDLVVAKDSPRSGRFMFNGIESASAASDDESAGPGDGILSTLSFDAATSKNDGEAIEAQAFASESEITRLTSAPISGAISGVGTRGNSSVPVQKAPGSRPRVFQTRSKSWSGKLAQLPRQWSMESREKKTSPHPGNEMDVDSRSKEKEEAGTKRKGGLKRKKKRRSHKPNEAMAAIDIAARNSTPVMPAVLVAGEESDIGEDAIPNGTAAPSIPPPVEIELTEISLEKGKYGERPRASAPKDTVNQRTVSSSALHLTRKAKLSTEAIGAALSSVGRSMSTEEGRRRRGRHSVSQMQNISIDSHSGPGSEGHLPVVIEGETGLPSYKGSAPWSRKPGSNRVRDPLKIFGSSTEGKRKGRSGATDDGSGAGISSPGTSSHRARHSRKHPAPSAHSVLSGNSSSGHSKGGFLRGLFSKRR